jgi:putative nucleotidyltransferase with HDIG domain
MILAVALDPQALVREAANLAPLPRAAVRLITLLGGDEWKPQEVLDVVRLDPVLTGKVLGAANSARAAAQDAILDLGEAVRRIGPRAVVGLALAAGVKGRMWPGLPHLGLAEGELWRHSVATLFAAEAAGAHLGTASSTAAVTAALLHDVGKVLLARFLDPETLDYLRLALLDEKRSAREAEREVLAFTHAELGALVAAHWGLPEDIVGAIRHHHEPGEAPAAGRADALAVQLADAVAKDVAPPAIGAVPDERERVRAACGLTAGQMDAFAALVRTRFELVGALY